MSSATEPTTEHRCSQCCARWYHIRAYDGSSGYKRPRPYLVSLYKRGAKTPHTWIDEPTLYSARQVARYWEAQVPGARAVITRVAPAKAKSK